MTEHLLISLASILVLGISAQWLAWRLRLPVILLLLVFGILAGPVTRFLDPEALLGNLLLPIVSLSVAVVLFEGGLSLRLVDLPQVGGVIRNLLSIGVVTTWLISTFAAYWLVRLDFTLAFLLGAIVVVSGPTVIGPLLRHVRPVSRLSSILKWEGIVIDPIGAMLAVLVFEATLAGEMHRALAGEMHRAPMFVLIGVLKTIAIGGGFGSLSAGGMIFLLKRYWVPDFLQNAVSLTVVIGAFAASNALQAESGLLTVTVMGMVLANQQIVPIRHIIEFKENLRVLLVSGLFVLLAARLNASNLAFVGIGSLAFLGVLILVVRPVAVALSTVGSDLTWRERVFLAWMAPRGIVAAAVSSIFALHLAEAGYPQAILLGPITFIVIIGTVAFYSLTASPVARWLQVAQPNPQGVLIVGAHAWARAIAAILQENGYAVRLLDTNWANVSAARMDGLSASYANVLSESVADQLDLDGIGRLLALTPNDEVNALATLHFAELFGRAEVYQLAPQGGEHRNKETLPQHLRGRLLFGSGITYTTLSKLGAGTTVKTTRLTKEFDYQAFRKLYGAAAILLFVITESGDLVICTAEEPPTPRSGQTLISLVNQEALPSAHPVPPVEGPTADQVSSDQAM